MIRKSFRSVITTPGPLSDKWPYISLSGVGAKSTTEPFSFLIDKDRVGHGHFYGLASKGRMGV